MRLDEALDSEQCRAAGKRVTLDHPTAGPIEAVASPYKLHRTPVERYAVLPLLDAVLAEVLELRRLRVAGAIGRHTGETT